VSIAKVAGVPATIILGGIDMYDFTPVEKEINAVTTTTDGSKIENVFTETVLTAEQVADIAMQVEFALAAKGRLVDRPSYEPRCSEWREDDNACLEHKVECAFQGVRKDCLEFKDEAFGEVSVFERLTHLVGTEYRTTSWKTNESDLLERLGRYEDVLDSLLKDYHEQDDHPDYWLVQQILDLFGIEA
jgi:hypothetical protein